MLSQITSISYFSIVLIYNINTPITLRWASISQKSIFSFNFFKTIFRICKIHNNFKMKNAS